MGVTSNKGCTGPWEPVDTEKVHYEFTGCPDDAKVYNEVVWGDSEDITFGQYNEICAGAYLDITVGMLLEVVIGPMLEVCVGGSFEMAGMPAAMGTCKAPPSVAIRAPMCAGMLPWSKPDSPWSLSSSPAYAALA